MSDEYNDVVDINDGKDTGSVNETSDATKDGEEQKEAPLTEDKEVNKVLENVGNTDGSKGANETYDATKDGEEQKEAPLTEDKGVNEVLEDVGTTDGSEGASKIFDAAKEGEEQKESPPIEDKGVNEVLEDVGNTDGSKGANETSDATKDGEEKKEFTRIEDGEVNEVPEDTQAESAKNTYGYASHVVNEDFAGSVGGIENKTKDAASNDSDGQEKSYVSNLNVNDMPEGDVTLRRDLPPGGKDDDSELSDDASNDSDGQEKSHVSNLNVNDMPKGDVTLRRDLPPGGKDDDSELLDDASPQDGVSLQIDEFDVLKRGESAINKRLEGQEIEYRSDGMSEDEIQDKLAADKWAFQKEFLQDAFPGQNISPNVFNGFSENGSKDRIAEINRSESLRKQIADDSADATAENKEGTSVSDEREIVSDPESPGEHFPVQTDKSELNAGGDSDSDDVVPVSKREPNVEDGEVQESADSTINQRVEDLADGRRDSGMIEDETQDSNSSDSLREKGAFDGVILPTETDTSVEADEPHVESSNYETPNISETKKDVEIKEGAFDFLPEGRRAAVLETFEQAPAEIKQAINDLSNKLKVVDTGDIIDKNGDLVREKCCYDVYDEIIKMDPRYDDGEYAEVFRHEFGHFLDFQLGSPSIREEFINSIRKDMMQFEGETGSLKKKEMLDELAGSDVINDRCVSDIFSGTFKNDPVIMDIYRQKKVDYWNHDNEYWDGTQGGVFSKEREVFANLVSVYSASDRASSIKFLEKYYPSTAQQFKEFFSMKGANDG